MSQLTTNEIAYASEQYAKAREKDLGKIELNGIANTIASVAEDPNNNTTFSVLYQQALKNPDAIGMTKDEVKSDRGKAVTEIAKKSWVDLSQDIFKDVLTKTDDPMKAQVIADMALDYYINKPGQQPTELQQKQFVLKNLMDLQRYTPEGKAYSSFQDLYRYMNNQAVEKGIDPEYLPFKNQEKRFNRSTTATADMDIGQAERLWAGFASNLIPMQAFEIAGFNETQSKMDAYSQSGNTDWLSTGASILGGVAQAIAVQKLLPIMNRNLATRPGVVGLSTGLTTSVFASGLGDWAESTRGISQQFVTPLARTDKVFWKQYLASRAFDLSTYSLGSMVGSRFIESELMGRSLAQWARTGDVNRMLQAQILYPALDTTADVVLDVLAHNSIVAAFGSDEPVFTNAQMRMFSFDGLDDPNINKGEYIADKMLSLIGIRAAARVASGALSKAVSRDMNRDDNAPDLLGSNAWFTQQAKSNAGRGRSNGVLLSVAKTSNFFFQNSLSEADHLFRQRAMGETGESGNLGEWLRTEVNRPNSPITGRNLVKLYFAREAAKNNLLGWIGSVIDGRQILTGDNAVVRNQAEENILLQLIRFNNSSLTKVNLASDADAIGRAMGRAVATNGITNDITPVVDQLNMLYSTHSFDKDTELKIVTSFKNELQRAGGANSGDMQKAIDTYIKDKSPYKAARNQLGDDVKINWRNTIHADAATLLNNVDRENTIIGRQAAFDVNLMTDIHRNIRRSLDTLRAGGDGILDVIMNTPGTYAGMVNDFEAFLRANPDFGQGTATAGVHQAFKNVADNFVRQRANRTVNAMQNVLRNKDKMSNDAAVERLTKFTNDIALLANIFPDNTDVQGALARMKQMGSEASNSDLLNGLVNSNSRWKEIISAANESEQSDPFTYSQLMATLVADVDNKRYDRHLASTLISDMKMRDGLTVLNHVIGGNLDHAAMTRFLARQEGFNILIDTETDSNGVVISDAQRHRVGGADMTPSLLYAKTAFVTDKLSTPGEGGDVVAFHVANLIVAAIMKQDALAEYDLTVNQMRKSNIFKQFMFGNSGGTNGYIIRNVALPAGGTRVELEITNNSQFKAFLKNNESRLKTDINGLIVESLAPRVVRSDAVTGTSKYSEYESTQDDFQVRVGYSQDDTTPAIFVTRNDITDELGRRASRNGIAYRSTVRSIVHSAPTLQDAVDRVMNLIRLYIPINNNDPMMVTNMENYARSIVSKMREAGSQELTYDMTAGTLIMSGLPTGMIKDVFPDNGLLFCTINTGLDIEVEDRIKMNPQQLYTKHGLIRLSGEGVNDNAVYWKIPDIDSNDPYVLRRFYSDVLQSMHDMVSMQPVAYDINGNIVQAERYNLLLDIENRQSAAPPQTKDEIINEFLSIMRRVVDIKQEQIRSLVDDMDTQLQGHRIRLGMQGAVYERKIREEAMRGFGNLFRSFFGSFGYNVTELRDKDNAFEALAGLASKIHTMENTKQSNALHSIVTTHLSGMLNAGNNTSLTPQQRRGAIRQSYTTAVDAVRRLNLDSDLESEMLDGLTVLSRPSRQAKIYRSMERSNYTVDEVDFIQTIRDTVFSDEMRTVMRNANQQMQLIPDSVNPERIITRFLQDSPGTSDQMIEMQNRFSSGLVRLKETLEQKRLRAKADLSSDVLNAVNNAYSVTGTIVRYNNDTFEEQLRRSAIITTAIEQKEDELDTLQSWITPNYAGSARKTFDQLREKDNPVPMLREFGNLLQFGSKYMSNRDDMQKRGASNKFIGHKGLNELADEVRNGNRKVVMFNLHDMEVARDYPHLLDGGILVDTELYDYVSTRGGLKPIMNNDEGFTKMQLQGIDGETVIVEHLLAQYNNRLARLAEVATSNGNTIAANDLLSQRLGRTADNVITDRNGNKVNLMIFDQDAMKMQGTEVLRCTNTLRENSLNDTVVSNAGSHQIHYIKFDLDMARVNTVSKTGAYAHDIHGDENAEVEVITHSGHIANLLSMMRFHKDTDSGGQDINQTQQGANTDILFSTLANRQLMQNADALFNEIHRAFSSGVPLTDAAFKQWFQGISNVASDPLASPGVFRPIVNDWASGTNLSLVRDNTGTTWNKADLGRDIHQITPYGTFPYQGITGGNHGTNYAVTATGSVGWITKMASKYYSEQMKLNKRSPDMSITYRNADGDEVTEQLRTMADSLSYLNQHRRYVGNDATIRNEIVAHATRLLAFMSDRTLFPDSHVGMYQVNGVNHFFVGLTRFPMIQQGQGQSLPAMITGIQMGTDDVGINYAGLRFNLGDKDGDTFISQSLRGIESVVRRVVSSTIPANQFVNAFQTYALNAFENNKFTSWATAPKVADDVNTQPKASTASGTVIGSFKEALRMRTQGALFAKSGNLLDTMNESVKEYLALSNGYVRIDDALSHLGNAFTEKVVLFDGEQSLSSKTGDVPAAAFKGAFENYAAVRRDVEIGVDGALEHFGVHIAKTVDLYGETKTLMLLTQTDSPELGGLSYRVRAVMELKNTARQTVLGAIDAISNDRSQGTLGDRIKRSAASYVNTERVFDYSNKDLRVTSTELIHKMIQSMSIDAPGHQKLYNFNNATDVRQYVSNMLQLTYASQFFRTAMYGNGVFNGNNLKIPKPDDAVRVRMEQSTADAKQDPLAELENFTRSFDMEGNKYMAAVLPMIVTKIKTGMLSDKDYDVIVSFGNKKTVLDFSLADEALKILEERPVFKQLAELLRVKGDNFFKDMSETISPEFVKGLVALNGFFRFRNEMLNKDVLIKTFGVAEGNVRDFITDKGEPVQPKIVDKAGNETLGNIRLIGLADLANVVNKIKATYGTLGVKSNKVAFDKFRKTIERTATLYHLNPEDVPNVIVDKLRLIHNNGALVNPDTVRQFLRDAGIQMKRGAVMTPDELIQLRERDISYNEGFSAIRNSNAMKRNLVKDYGQDIIDRDKNLGVIFTDSSGKELSVGELYKKCANAVTNIEKGMRSKDSVIEVPNSISWSMAHIRTYKDIFGALVGETDLLSRGSFDILSSGIDGEVIARINTAGGITGDALDLYREKRKYAPLYGTADSIIAHSVEDLHMC